MSPEEVRRLYAERRAADRQLGWCRHDGDDPALCPECGVNVADELDRSLKGWRLLWAGTLGLLQRQEPLAYRRLLAALARHGLTGLEFPARGPTTGMPLLRLPHDTIGQRPIPPVGPQLGFPPSDALLTRYTAFADDRRLVGLRGRAKPVPPSVLLSMVYDRVRAHLRQAGPQPLRGETLQARALAQLGKYCDGYTAASLEKLVRRGRRERERLFPRGSKAARGMAMILDARLGYPPTPLK